MAKVDDLKQAALILELMATGQPIHYDAMSFLQVAIRLREYAREEEEYETQRMGYDVVDPQSQANAQRCDKRGE